MKAFGSMIDVWMKLSGLPLRAWSRSGPLLAVEPASESLWQPVQPAVANTCLPAAVEAAVVDDPVVDDPVVVEAVVSPPCAASAGAWLPASSSASVVLPDCSFCATFDASSA